MRARAILSVGLVALAVGACGSAGDEDSEEGGPCDQRSGTYRATFAERSGTCGGIPEQLDTIDVQPTVFDPPCTGTIDYSADNCSVTSEGTCPEDGLGAGWTSTIELKATWNASGSRGTAIQQVVLYNDVGGIVCQSTYNVVLTRI